MGSAKPKQWRIDSKRPVTRDDCRDYERPCPWVGCKWNLLLDVAHTGALIFNLPGRGRQKITVPDEDTKKANATFQKLEGQLLGEFERRRDEQVDTCMIDMQERQEPITLEDIGRVMALTRERIRQIELDALDDSHDSDELKEERDLRGVHRRGSKRGGGGASGARAKSRKRRRRKKTR